MPAAFEVCNEEHRKGILPTAPCRLFPGCNEQGCVVLECVRRRAPRCYMPLKMKTSSILLALGARLIQQACRHLLFPKLLQNLLAFLTSS